jgi:hypothetical protein
MRSYGLIVGMTRLPLPLCLYGPNLMRAQQKLRTGMTERSPAERQ